MKGELKLLLEKAYAPYSKVSVGAIVKTDKGIFKGVNIENSAFPSGICAERAAIFSAISSFGKNQIFLEIHIASSLENVLYPCGACLQVMTEFFSDETTFFIYDKNFNVAYIKKMSDFLPFKVKKESFGWK